MFRNYCAQFLFILAFSGFGQKEVTNINAFWEFRKQNGTQFSIVNLPHTFNANDAFEDTKSYYRGKAIYRRVFDTENRNQDI